MMKEKNLVDRQDPTNQTSNLELVWSISYQVREKKAKKKIPKNSRDNYADKATDIEEEEDDEDDNFLNFPIRSIESDLDLSHRSNSTNTNVLDKNSKISGYKEPDRASNIEEMKIESNCSHIDPLYTGISTLTVDDPSAPPASLGSLSSFKTIRSSLEMEKKSPLSEGMTKTHPLIKFKKILKNVKGFARTGDFIAIVGPSGSGKSVFLECLALRKKGFEGEIYLNQKSVDAAYFNMTALVYPDDNFYLTLTVEEHLEYQAVSRKS